MKFASALKALPIALLLISSASFSMPADEAKVAHKVEASAEVTKIDKIKAFVFEAEESLQKTLDELTAKKDSFGADWKNIEEGFVYYSRTESDYLNGLIENQEPLCINLGGKECHKVAEHTLYENAREMLARAELIRKVALKEKLPAFTMKLTESLEAPLNKEIRNGLRSGLDKGAFIETSRLFMRMKMTYLGLLDQLAITNKEDGRAAMIEHEMARQNKIRGETLAQIWKAAGNEPVAPRKIGETRRAAMLNEFHLDK